jgi:hypothetical protein
MVEAKRLIVAALVLAVFCTGCLGDEEPDRETEPPLFERLRETETNIEFANTLSEQPTPHRTELLYEYFSNGAGVAAGDVNGDGRVDIYFTGNMRYNTLYLNEGDMQFRDVTERAGVQGRRNTWNTGMTMADVNGDGRLDIYVCYSGDLPLDRRVDELHINQGVDENGIPQFEEQAAEYGLANPHSSNQAYFFDYDRDGDLDLFLQTHNVNTPPRGTPQSIQRTLSEQDPVNGNRFYENREGTFVDVTAAIGIRGTPLNYGLGAGISDVNKDGWPDIYVGNDYSPPDYLYLNNEGEGFTNQLPAHMGHTSQASMGVDVADINNDHLTDIFVLDMISEGNRRQKLLHLPNDRALFKQDVASGLHYQYTVNTLQLNNGNGTFSEIGQLAGVSNTDWSWATLIADFNNDGWKDIFVSNGILHDFTSRDFLQFRFELLEQKNYSLEPSDVQTLMDNLPSTDLENYVFKNEGGITFRDVSTAWNLDAPFNSNGAAYADLDNDGDLDLITNNINETASVYENTVTDRRNHNYLKVQLRGTSPNTYGIGAKLTLYAGEESQYLEQFPARGYLSSVSPILHFGLAEQQTIDSLRVVWPDGRTQLLRDLPANQTLTLHQEEADGSYSAPRPDTTLFQETSPPFAYRHTIEGTIDDFRRQPLLVHAKSFEGPALATADVNGDGLTDVFVGGGNRQASMLYVQQPSGAFVPRPQPALETHRASNNVDALFFDADGDGDMDLYVASGGYGGVSQNDPALQDRLYLNDGSGSFTAAPDALPRMRTSTGAVATADVNSDGRPDLFVGGRVEPERYPESPRSYVLINTGPDGFADRTAEVAPDLQTPGMVTDAHWHDLNGNGTEELIVAGEWMPIAVFENDDGVLNDRTEDYFDRRYHGFWYSLELFRLGDSGRLGLLAGNLGRNTQLHAREEEPAELFFDDFDRNGRPDPILSYYIGGNRYPHMLLDRLRETVPPLGARFSSHGAYADATLDDLLTADEQQAAERLAVDELGTSLFLLGDGHQFERAPLPTEAQFAPIFSTEPLDYNGDGQTDLLLAGNMNETRVRFAKYDANYGMLLRGDGDGGFEYIPQRTSGFKVRGDVRAMATIQNQMLFGVNRDSLVAYRSAAARPPRAEENLAP